MDNQQQNQIIYSGKTIKPEHYNILINNYLRMELLSSLSIKFKYNLNEKYYQTFILLL